MSLTAYHHSRLLQYRHPQGAAPTGSFVTLCAQTREFGDAACMVFCKMDESETVTLMQPQGEGLYAANIKMPMRAGLLYYHFILNDGSRLYYAGGRSGQSVLTDMPGEMFHITVYHPFETPSWVANGVMYQIFVDRFARGSGRGGLERINYHTALGREMHVHESWEDMPDYLPRYGEPYYRPNDFFGGDLRGVIEKLPYLSWLGVTCLYLNPIFESDSNHKYNTSDYRKIDPMYGTQADFEELCTKAKQRGIRVLLDGVFSHTGDDSVYFNKYGRYDSQGAYQSEQSPYKDWYSFEKFPDRYSCWWGFTSLPNVNEMEQSYITFIAQGEDAVLKHWIKAGGSGWRLDVADELPDSFIKILRSEVKKEDPDALLLGEVWEDATTKYSMNTQRKFAMGEELDGVMNYPLREAILGFFQGKYTAQQTAEYLEVQRENYPAPFAFACMNLLSSHDTPRAISVLGRPDTDNTASREQQARFSLDDVQRASGRNLFGSAMALQMILPGMPSIYYGDEAGVEGLMDPFNRSTYPWGKEYTPLLELAHTLIGLRRTYSALRTGGMVLLAVQDALCVVRFDDKTKFIAAFSIKPCDIELDFNRPLEGPDGDFAPDGMYQDVQSGEITVCESGRMHIRIEQGFVIYKNQ